MDAAERELLTSTIRQLASTSTGPALDGALAELGWTEALAAEPRTAVAALFEAQGESATTSSALHLVLGAALGHPGVVAVLPPLGRWDPPGAGATFEGLLLGDHRDATVFTVITDRGADVGIAPAHVELTPVAGMDPALGLSRARGELPAPTGSPPTPAPWAEAVAAGQRALAHELIGSMAAMLELARAHALERIQFGQPIAGFQAVRHRLADSYVALAAARAAAEAAWDDGTPHTAGVAKAIAGRNARLVAKHAQQVLAGIGFTAEHRFHQHLRRVLLLDGLLGDAKHLTRAQGAELLRSRRLPAILPL